MALAWVGTQTNLWNLHVYVNDEVLHITLPSPPHPLPHQKRQGGMMAQHRSKQLSSVTPLASLKLLGHHPREGMTNFTPDLYAGCNSVPLSCNKILRGTNLSGHVSHFLLHELVGCQRSSELMPSNKKINIQIQNYNYYKQEALINKKQAVFKFFLRINKNNYWKKF